MFTNPNSRALLTHTVLVFSAVIILSILAVILFLNNRSRVADLEHGYENAKRLAESIADGIELNFVTVDLTLGKASDYQQLNQSEEPTANLSEWLKETPNLKALFIADEHGLITSLASKNQGDSAFSPGMSVADAAFFTWHDGSSNKPAIFLLDNGDIIMSRRIDGIDGHFSGIVAGIVNEASLTQLFNAMIIGKKTQFTLLGKNQALLQVPINPLISTKMLLPIIAASEVYDQPTESIVTLQKNVDDTLWIFAFKSLKHYPLFVSLSLHEDDVFINSRANRSNYFFFFFIFSSFAVIISVFTLLMSRQIEQVQKSEKAAILASQAKSDFLAKMSHELRTPLNAIIGFSQMMDSGYFGAINDKQRDRIHDINLCGNHLLELINDILEFSKGESGKLLLAEEQTDFVQLINKVLRILDQRAKVAEVALVADLPSDIPLLLADERKIRQTLLNLLSNAVKFTPRGGKVQISAAIDFAGRFKFSVADTGIGIAHEDIPKALSVFGQVHTHLNTEGTGLGLPLCKMFIELHGGDLKLESTLNKGTTITVIFPAYRTIYRT